MRRVLSYLKPYLGQILIVFILLFIQAISDLSLPNYMSNIINVGLQQSGITENHPKAIDQRGYQLMQIFMDEEDRNAMGEGYELITKKSDQYEKYKKEYPTLEKEDIYVQKENADTNKLDDIFGDAVVTMTNFSRSLPREQNSSEQTMDLETLYQMLPILENIPQEQIAPFIEEAKKEESSMLKQAGTVFVKLFYEYLSVDTGKLQQDYIVSTGIKMIGLAFVISLTAVGVGYFSARIGTGFSKDLRKSVFEKTLSFSTVEMKNFSTASLITRTTNDITQIENLVIMGLRMICYAPIIGIGGIIMALSKSASMSWIIALAVIIILCLIFIIFSIAMPKFKLIQKLIDRLNLVARESLNGMLVIRAFSTQKFEKERFDEANKNLANNNLFVLRVISLMMPIMTLVMNGIVILIVWVGAHRIESSAMQVGDMMAFMQYAIQIVMSFLMIAIMFVMIPRSSVSAKRISEVLETENSIKDPKKSKAFNPKKRGYVEFQNVNFRYKDAEEDVLHHITFTAEPGKTTAFIGSTGSGKSTLINLIPRFFDVTGGKILVNGVDVREIKKQDLCDMIGYIPQKGMLLSGTIASNLRYGKKNASLEELKKAAQVAQASDFIEAKEDGYESHIAQGGSNVSGGQKQRLSIARALVKKPDIYIFDDSFSALDFKTDANLRAALKEYTKGSTVLIVAQRISTIMNAEQIVVLDKGEVVGIGTHEELLKNCKTYYEIASSQLGSEELL